MGDFLFCWFSSRPYFSERDRRFILRSAQYSLSGPSRRGQTASCWEKSTVTSESFREIWYKIYTVVHVFKASHLPMYILRTKEQHWRWPNLPRFSRMYLISACGLQIVYHSRFQGWDVLSHVNTYCCCSRERINSSSYKIFNAFIRCYCWIVSGKDVTWKGPNRIAWRRAE